METTLIRPAAPPMRGEAALGTWFEAPTAHGPLQLCLGEGDGPAAHAAAAALALQRAAALLQSIDDWLGDDAPDWRWQPVPVTRPDPAALRLPGRDGGHQLIAPWRWLRALPAPSEALAARLQWPAIEARLAIARLRLAADELQQLEPGGAVLLPASMRPGWTGLLRGSAEDADAGVPVALDDPARPQLLQGSAATPLEPASRRAGHAAGPGAGRAAGPDPGLGAGAGAGAGAGRLCELRLHLSCTLPADCLAGWRAEPLHQAVVPDLAATLWQLAAAREPERCLAHGRLLPWGDGWALLIGGLGDGLVDGLVDGLGEEAAQAHVLPA